MNQSFINPETMWVFDIDGVLTNPEQKRIIYPDLVSELVKRLKHHEPIGLNTGRSFTFIEQEIIKPLQEQSDTPDLLSLLFPVGEYGGVWMTYDKGIFHHHTNPSLLVPQNLKQHIQEMAQTTYQDTIFFDQDKQTMISLELLKRKSVHAFQEIAPLLHAKIETILHDEHLEDQWKIQTTRICMDVQHTSVGKDYGIFKILELLEQKGIAPKKFISFGDSISDVAMHKALIQTSKPSHFIFVGEPELLHGKNIQHYTFTAPQLCDEGTLHYLKTH